MESPGAFFSRPHLAGLAGLVTSSCHRRQGSDTMSDTRQSACAKKHKVRGPTCFEKSRGALLPHPPLQLGGCVLWWQGLELILPSATTFDAAWAAVEPASKDTDLLHPLWGDRGNPRHYLFSHEGYFLVVSAQESGVGLVSGVPRCLFSRPRLGRHQDCGCSPPAAELTDASRRQARTWGPTRSKESRGALLPGPPLQLGDFLRWQVRELIFPRGGHLRRLQRSPCSIKRMFAPRV